MSSSYVQILFFAALIAVFYFFMIRPESKKKKQITEMRANLSNGDEVTTMGGIIGKICDINGEKVTIETGADRVRIQLLKAAISSKDSQSLS